MIRFEQVGKRYPNGHIGLHELSFQVRRGEFLFVTGHSGAAGSVLAHQAMNSHETGFLQCRPVAQTGSSEVSMSRARIASSSRLATISRM